MLVMAPNIGSVARGKMVFGFIAAILFGFALLAGIFFTADCLCEEKKEGTLGLLFLTDLEGYDVVFGKLIATSLHAIYGLVATLPLLAYSVLLGGVTGGELIRITAALFITLLFSLTVGMVVSSLCDDSRQAMGISMAILFVFGAAPEILTGLIGSVIRKYHPVVLPALSPTTLFRNAFDGIYHSGGKLQYWAALCLITLITVTGMVFAGRKIGLVWHEEKEDEAEAGQKSRWLLGKSVARTGAAQQSRLDRSPFLWLATRDKTPAVQAFRAVAVLAAMSVAAAILSFSNNTSRSFAAFVFAMGMAYGCHQALKWFVALEASRRLSEDRRSGALELILVTPLLIEEIVSGQRQAMAINFRRPLFVVVAINLVLMVVAKANPLHLMTQQVILIFELCIGGIAMLFLDFYALSWVGMWMALVSPRHQRAVIGTVGRVVIFPWVAILFLGLLTMGGVPIDPDVMVILCFAWFGFAAMIEATFIARAKIGLTEAMRKISSDPTLSTLDMPALQIAEETV